MAEKRVLEFSDADGNKGVVKVYVKPMTTLDAMSLTPKLAAVERDPGAGVPIETVIEAWRASVVNIEAPEFKFRVENMRENINLFSIDEVEIVTLEIVSLMNLPAAEKKISDSPMPAK